MLVAPRLVTPVSGARHGIRAGSAAPLSHSSSGINGVHVKTVVGLYDRLRQRRGRCAVLQSVRHSVNFEVSDLKVTHCFKMMLRQDCEHGVVIKPETLSRTRSFLSIKQNQETTIRSASRESRLPHTLRGKSHPAFSALPKLRRHVLSYTDVSVARSQDGRTGVHPLGGCPNLAQRR